MAFRLKIEGFYLVVFEDGAPETEYISNPTAVTVAKFPDTTNVQFYDYSQKIDGIRDPHLLGNENSIFEITSLVDDDTGSVFASVSEFKFFIRGKIGFFNNASRLTDYWISHAIDVILEDYGDVVSVEAKNKDLIKFGENRNIGTVGATIMDLAGNETEETFVTGNDITHVVSSSVSDTMDITIFEGHTISGSDASFYKASANITLSGRTPVALPTGVFRANRARIESKANGDISFYEGGAVTSGVPDDDTQVHLTIKAGEVQTQKAQTTISSNDYWIVLSFRGSVLEKAASWIDFNLQMKPITETEFFPISQNINVSSESGTIPSDYKPYIIVPKNHDIRLFGKADAGNTFGAGGIVGVLVAVV